MREVADDFGKAGVEIRLHENWRAARWRKLVWNVPFNGLCSLHGLDTRSLLARPDLRALARGLMEEVLAGAALEGCSLPDGFADRMMKDTEAMVPYEPSMKLDRDAGRPMELDAIYARPLAAIRKAGGAAPLMESLLADLSRLGSLQAEG
jgi:2-dehydropantoate 2-reductase